MERNSVRTQEAGFGKRVAAAVMLAAYVSVLTPFQLVAEAVPAEAKPGAAVSVREEKSEVLISARDGGKVVLGEASIEIPEGALKEDTKISITRLHAVEDTGESLYNAIPMAGGYRFLPAGTKFEKDVTITLPYSAELNSKPQSLDELYTYFYDTEAKSWVKLERLEVDREGCKVRSLSSHFTDMINATLTLPEAASPVDVNLNSIKNLEAARPDSHLIKFNPPKAGNTGDASFSLELSVPAGRRGMQPHVSIGYSSGAGNGIMGRGFDVSYGSCITTDTRLGLPEYDTRDSYMIDGVLLDEKTRSGDTVTYVPQREAQFSRIVRHGAGTESDWWEVTDKGGTKRTYAQSTESCVGGGKKTFTWNLTEMADTRGNTVKYKYAKDDGYVYPDKILYTGSDGKDGNYSVEFHYDGNGVKRQDVRIDARSREIISCRKLLTGITTHYKDGGAIRTYAFEYKEGLAKESMLTSLSVKNNAGESYAYTFGYEEAQKDGNGNPVFFHDAEPWINGRPLSESGGKSSGGNVHASAGTGIGTDSLDGRATAGITSSSSNSSSYTRETLIDIDGDGKNEGVAQRGSTLYVYRQNSAGNGFEAEPEQIDLSALIKGGKSFLMNEESSSTTSSGWNVYGGLGSKNGIYSEGVVKSRVSQDGSTRLHSGFYDMDGDGLVDIVTGTGGYLHNDSSGGEIKFSRKTIANYPGTEPVDLGKKLTEYKKAYCIQRPFLGWKSIYDGTVRVRMDYAAGSAFKVLGIHGDREIDPAGEIEVRQGESLYFIPDVGDDPKLSDLEKERNWENTVEYTRAKAFGRDFGKIVFFPEEILARCPESMEDLYDHIYDEKSRRYYYKLKQNKTVDGKIRMALIKEGRFVPGILTEEVFGELKEHAIEQSLKIEVQPQQDAGNDAKSMEQRKLVAQKNFMERLADSYEYSAADRLFHIKKTASVDKAFYDSYFKDFIKGETLEKILASYNLNGIDADFSGEEPEYKRTVSASYPAGERFRDGIHAPGASFVRDGRKLICLGRMQGKDIVVDRESGAIVSPGEFGDSMSAEISGENYVLTAADGSSTVTYSMKEKIPFADSLSEEEFLLIASEYKSKYPNNTLGSSVWNSQTPVPREKIEALLRDANVTGEDEQGEFIRLVYDEKTDGGAVLLERKNHDSGTVHSEESLRAEKILKDAMCRKVRGSDFTYYDADNRLKDEYRSMKLNDSRLVGLESLCGKYGLYSYAECSVEVVYSREAYFPVQDGMISLIIPMPDSGLSYEARRLEFPDGNSVFNSARDFSQENILASREDLLHIKTYTMPGGLASCVSVRAEEFLYGGKNGWFYGIWTGSEKENAFTETRLNSLFRDADTSGLDEYSKGETEDDIKSSGKKMGGKIDSKSEKKDVAFVCMLPEKEGSLLKGITSQYIEETVYDDGGVPNARSRIIDSKPYVGAGTVACNRLGGNAYFSIEGVPECTSTVAAPLQKTNTSGTDTTIGPQVCFIGLGNNTETENEGSAEMVQTLQDVNGDRIPDVVKKAGGEWHLYFGSADYAKNIEYPVEPSLKMASHGALSKNYNDTTSSGFSFSPQGAVINSLTSTGRQRSVSLTNGFGKSWFKGSNSTEASILDINADGVADYVNGSTVYLGTGEEYKESNKTGTKFDYGWDRTGMGAVSGDSGSLTIAGLSIGTELIVKDGAGQKLKSGPSADIGGCSSVSTSTQSQILLDMNGDGLPDVVRKADVQDDDGNCIYEVYYNTGSVISRVSPVTVRIPKWKDIKLTNLTVSNRAINSNGISCGGKSVTLAEKEAIGISSAGKEIENLDCSVTASTNITGNVSMNINIPIPIPGPMSYLQFNITANEGGGINSGSTSTSATVRMLDLDGDGLADQVLKISGGGIYWKRNLSGKIGLLKQVSLPQGGSVEIDYAEKYGTVYNPNFKYVMDSVTMNDGTDGEGLLPRLEHGGHSVTTLYDYDGGYYDRQKKEFYGFKTVRTTLADGTSQTDEYYNLEYYSKGCTKKSSSHSKDGQLLSESRTELCPSPVALPLSEESWSYEMSSGNAGCIHTSAEYEYDGWGNCTKVMQDFGGGQKLTAEIAYDNNDTANYIIGLPVDIRVYGSDGSLMRRREGRYDHYGQLEELHQYYDAYNYTENKISYDGYGNIKSMSDSRGATVSYSYDKEEHMLATGITQKGKDTEAYGSTVEYDMDTQTKTMETDCNGNTLKYKYDAWQRIAEIFTAYDGSMPAVRYEYHTPTKGADGKCDLWYALTCNKITFDKTDTSVIQTVIQIDGLGRAVRTAKTGCVNGEAGWNASGAVEYDCKGRTVKEGMTEFIGGTIADLLQSSPKMTELFTSYEYDEKDRPVTSILPDNSVQKNAYYMAEDRLVSESTDPLGNVSVQEADGRGNIVRVARKDSAGRQLTEVTYEYNEMGEMLKAFDAKGNPISVEYDLLGRRTALESLDSGRQEFFYDECSNLVRENNSVLRENNKQILYEYDGLNRLVRIDYPDTEDTSYTYGKPSDRNVGAAGKILSIEDASGKLSYVYGSLGEVTKETRTLLTHLNGSSTTETAVMEYRADYLGRMQWIVYPDGEKVTYGYDCGGQVVTVKGEHYGRDFPYVKDILYDQYGQRTKIVYGNETETEYSYDSARRWLDTIKTCNKWGKSLQNISYSFDAVGNVLGYENNCLDMVTGNYRTSQTYSYDNLYQLVKADGETVYDPHHSGGAPEFKSKYSQIFEFDADGLGNMTGKASQETVTPQKSIGDNLNYSFKYVYDEKYAHRLVSAGERYYKYDSNGNIVMEQDGSFEANGTEGAYHRINRETDDVYSTDYGWGLYKDSDGKKSTTRAYSRTYDWNERNLLVGSADANYTTTYVYGQDGQRSNKYTKNSETLYFNKMWTHRTDSALKVYGGQTAKNIYLGETRIVTKLNAGSNPTVQEESDKQYFYHSDHLGSASLISDCEGNEYQRIEYTPYGEIWVEKTENNGLAYLPYKFTGKEMDEETGLYYYGARYLDPKYSRWISTDPALGEYIPAAGKANAKDMANLPGMGGIFNHTNAGLFHYAGNNPVRYIDPDGRKVIVGISTSDSFWGRIFGEHAFIMVINEDIPEKSLMLDASGHYGGNRSADILDGYLIGISVEAYLRYWDTDEKLTTFELVLTKDEEGKIKNAISKIEGRSWMSCASIASEVLNENFSSEIEECCTPIGLLESLMKYEKKHSDKVIIKNYSLKTDQEIKDGKE